MCSGLCMYLASQYTRLGKYKGWCVAIQYTCSSTRVDGHFQAPHAIQGDVWTRRAIFPLIRAIASRLWTLLRQNSQSTMLHAILWRYLQFSVQAPAGSLHKRFLDTSWQYFPFVPNILSSSQFNHLSFICKCDGLRHSLSKRYHPTFLNLVCGPVLRVAWYKHRHQAWGEGVANKMLLGQAFERRQTMAYGLYGNSKLAKAWGVKLWSGEVWSNYRCQIIPLTSWDPY